MDVVRGGSFFLRIDVGVPHCFKTDWTGISVCSSHSIVDNKERITVKGNHETFKRQTCIRLYMTFSGSIHFFRCNVPTFD